MSTSLPIEDQDQQPHNAIDDLESAPASVSSQSAASKPIVLPPPAPVEEPFYTFEDDLPGVAATPLVAPFQLSHQMSKIETPLQSPTQESVMPVTPLAPTKKRGGKPQVSLMMIAIMICVVVIGGFTFLNAMAKTTPPLQMQSNSNGQTQTTQQSTQPPVSQPVAPTHQKQSTTKPMGTPAPTRQAPTNGPTGQGQMGSMPGNQSPTDWVPQQLPTGWTNAGLSVSDGIEAMRTAITFNDREMSLDFRSVGTRNNHGGTFTAATFLLTPAAFQRFLHNDVRKVDNTLFDMVQNTKLIRAVINVQPQLVQFAQQGQQQFAWVDVSFQVWQSQVDPNTQQAVEGKDLDPTTHQPRIHQMLVLLLRVQPQDAGTNPPMGGTGWLVSTYALDPVNGTPPAILEPA